MSQWRKAKDLGIVLCDITAKSGLKPYAPDFADVMAYKRGELSEEEYTKIYLDRMARSKIRFPKRWETLKNESHIAFACYCKVDAFCHRHLFISLVKEYLEAENYEVILMGEIK